MKLLGKNQVTSIILTAEKIMYGHLMIRIDDVVNDVVVKWITTSDGGMIVSNVEKTIPQKQIVDVVNMIYNMQFTEIEDEDASICWSLQLTDNMDNVIFAVDIGYWEQELLENIVNELDIFLEDEEVLADFYNMMA